MRKKAILPYDLNTYLNAYHSIAFPMGIVMANTKQDIMPWLCCKHINCRFEPSNINRFSIYLSDSWGEDDGILIRQKIDLFPDFHSVIYDDVAVLMRTMIDMGCYPQGPYNEEYIPGKFAYQKRYFYHDYMLIGYDDNEEIFYSVGYLADGKFQQFTIPYENMRQAIKTVDKPRIVLNFWKYNENFEYKPNFQRLISELSDYLNSVNNSPKVLKSRYWGMEAVRQLANYYLEFGEYGVDIRYTRCIMEHKFLMQKRMSYLFEQGYLSNDKYLKYSAITYKQAEMIHLLALKYNMTGRRIIVNSIYDKINEILLIENEYLPNVLCELSNNYSEVPV